MTCVVCSDKKYKNKKQAEFGLQGICWPLIKLSSFWSFHRIPMWFFQCLDSELVSSLICDNNNLCFIFLISVAQPLSILCSITANWILVFCFLPLFLSFFNFFFFYWFVLFSFSFILLSLALISFSAFLKWELRALISDLSFSHIASKGINSPLSTTLTASYKFWFMFYEPNIHTIFSFSLWFLFWPMDCFKSKLLELFKCVMLLISNLIVVRD